MSTKIRFVLPLAQVIIALILTASNSLRPDSLANPAWTKADWQLCGGLNAPATLVGKYPVDIAYLWFSRYYPVNLVVESVIRFSLIWLLWYIVAIEIGGRGLSVLATKSLMRTAVDVLAIVFGAVVGIVGLLVGSQFGNVFYGRLVSTPYLIWAIVIVGFYGHDLLGSFRETRLRADRAARRMQ